MINDTQENSTPSIIDNPEAIQQKARKTRITVIRGLVAAGVFVIVGIGLALHTGTGTLSSMGFEYISTICPVGGLEAMLGSWSFIPRILIGLAIVLIITLLIGKAFCSWACPVPHIQNVFKGKKQKKKEAAERQEAAQQSIQRWEEHGDTEKRPFQVDTRYVVLSSALVSTAIFGFPVFCLVCPIGLSIATFIALWHVFQFNEITWGLVIFPAIVVLELVFLRKWCGKICPIGALLSVMARFNKTLRPTADKSKCLRDTSGMPCEACASVCPEFIDPRSNTGNRPKYECVKCHRCADVCPTQAISFLKTHQPEIATTPSLEQVSEPETN